MSLTYKQRFNKKYGFPLNKSHSVDEIAKLTGYEKKGLEKILARGRGAFYTSPQSVRPHIKSPIEWSYARLYASVYGKGSKSYEVDKMFLKKKKKK